MLATVTNLAEMILSIDSYAHKALNQSLKAAVKLPANQIPCGMMHPCKTALRLKVYNTKLYLNNNVGGYECKIISYLNYLNTLLPRLAFVLT